MNNEIIERLREKYKNGEPVSILFVCLGNICRSPAAQGIMQQIVDAADDNSHFHIDSAGLYSGHAGQLPDKRMRVHANRRGYSLTHRARPARSWDLEEFDLIVGMDDDNIRGLKDLAPSTEEEIKIVRMTDFCRMHPYYDAVPDPYYEGASGFELVLDLLQDACQGLYNDITVKSV
ncbi:MAG: low molecular weight phosphotyrosine protein phosphatase [Prevotella sp.]|nr:low molecular weight phosphotyrosine protein phosphatase [Bacteroides sp.]MCM1366378.1 low molecular weight phosphotyrosine protein phosphatase [Prevotella sp.]MCM1436693.1 low molecular weight phosphotyrosine protein phosphatase [Prevotella sp.]